MASALFLASALRSLGLDIVSVSHWGQPSRSPAAPGRGEWLLGDCRDEEVVERLIVLVRSHELAGDL
jgi:hypothetical protein